MGCSLAARLVALKKELRRKYNPDFLFIEPSEMVVTRELKQVLFMGRRDISYEIGPLITLINGPAFDSQWQERAFLMIGQIQDADLVALARSDLLDGHGIHEREQQLMDYTRSVLPISVPGNVGIHTVLAAVTGSE